MSAKQELAPKWLVCIVICESTRQAVSRLLADQSSTKQQAALASKPSAVFLPISPLGAATEALLTRQWMGLPSSEAAAFLTELQHNTCFA